jgi:hypothetical protein
MADLELPAVTRADQALPVDEAVGDPAAIVRAGIGDHDEAPAAQSCHRDVLAMHTRRHHRTGGEAAGLPAHLRVLTRVPGDVLGTAPGVSRREWRRAAIAECVQAREPGRRFVRPGLEIEQ